MPLSNFPYIERRQLIKLAAKQCNPSECGLSSRIKQLLASRGIIAELREIVDCLK